MQIKKLHLHSYRGFSDYTIEFDSLTALTGPNNGGKTSVLMALKLLSDVTTYALGLLRDPMAKEVDFANLYFSQDPGPQLSRQSLSDHDSVWLNRNTTEPCQISATYSNDVEVKLTMSGVKVYLLDVIIEGRNIRDKSVPEIDKPILTKLFSFRPLFLPPVGAVSPFEQLISYPDLQNKLAEGKLAEHWRTFLYWLANSDSDRFETVIVSMQKHFPECVIKKPNLGTASGLPVRLDFEQNGVRHDMAAGGSGMRAVLALAACLHLSDSPCLLFDEPDSHLHPKLQRAAANLLVEGAAENGIQLILSTHAPDFIDELPIESLRWIDRNENSARTCSDVAEFLVDLGCISKSAALSFRETDRILFVEGALDQRLLSKLIALDNCKNPFERKDVMSAILRNGKGDTKHLHGFVELVHGWKQRRPRVAAIVDADYDLVIACTQKTPKSGPLVLKLSRKEAENYLIDPKVVVKAAFTARNARVLKDTKAECPSEVEIQTQIDRICQTEEIIEIVKYPLKASFKKTLAASLDDTTKDREADKWFTSKWSDTEFRTNHLPGKAVLAKLREWIKKQHRINLTQQALLDALSTCPPDISSLATDINAFFDI